MWSKPVARTVSLVLPTIVATRDEMGGVAPTSVYLSDLKLPPASARRAWVFCYLRSPTRRLILYLLCCHMFRAEAEPNVSQESVAQFDGIIADTAKRSRTISNLDIVAETRVQRGAGIEYPAVRRISRLRRRGTSHLRQLADPSLRLVLHSDAQSSPNRCFLDHPIARRPSAPTRAKAGRPSGRISELPGASA